MKNPFNYLDACSQEDKWAVSDGTMDSMDVQNFVAPRWLGWARGQPNGLGMRMGLEMCAAVGIGAGAPQMYDVDCGSSGYCYICTFKVKPKYTTKSK